MTKTDMNNEEIRLPWYVAFGLFLITIELAVIIGVLTQ